MKPIVSNDRIQTLGPHPKEAARFARPSRRARPREGGGWPRARSRLWPSFVLREPQDACILRQAFRSALLRMRSEIFALHSHLREFVILGLRPLRGGAIDKTRDVVGEFLALRNHLE